MADITVTPANVLPGTNAGIDSGIAGEAIAAGKTIYLNATTNRWMLSDNNGTGTRQVHGIALNAASAVSRLLSRSLATSLSARRSLPARTIGLAALLAASALAQT